LVKVFVAYDTRYGNTRLVAEKIVEGLREVEGTETAIGDVKDVDLERLADYDAVLIGSPNHFGGPTGSVKKFIDSLGKLHLSGKFFAVFDTYIQRDFEKAAKKMEKRVNEKAVGLKQITAGLSIKVEGVKGPITEEELSKCRIFGKQIANKLK